VSQGELVDADVEKEFLMLMARMKKAHIGQHLVYQINNYVEVRAHMLISQRS
jgi:hypothetical protein